MELLKKCIRCNTSMTSAKLLGCAVVCVLVAVTVSQSAETLTTPTIVTDPTIIISNSTNTNATVPSQGGGEGGGKGGGEGGGEGGDEWGEEGEAEEGGAEEGGAEEGGGGEGGGGEEAEGEEGTEGPDQEEQEGGNEALEDKIEDLVEMYRMQGLTASIEALQTMYPGVNFTDIFMEDMGPGERGKEGMENEIQGSEGGAYPGQHGKYKLPLHSLSSDMYGDYVMGLGQPMASYTYVPTGGLQGRGGIKPTPVVKPGTPNTKGGQARLDPGFGIVQAHSQGPYDPNKVIRHPTGMTASATFGVVVGTILLSWLIVGPALCLAWRWNEKRRENKKIFLQRPHLHGSVDEGINDAMVMSELGKASPRRQKLSDVEASLARNRSELQSFPTTTTMSSVVE